MTAHWSPSDDADRPAQRFNLNGASEAFDGALPIAKLFVEVLQTRRRLLGSYTDDDDVLSLFDNAAQHAEEIVSDLEEGLSAISDQLAQLEG